MQQRILCAWAAFREGRRKVYKCKQSPFTNRITSLQGLVLSTLLVGAGSRPPLSEGEGLALPAYAAQLLCSLGQPPKTCTGAPCVLAPACSARRRSCMLKGCTMPCSLLVRHLMNCGPFCVRSKHTVSSCFLFFAWLHLRIRTTCPLPAPVEGWDDWVHLLRRQPVKGWIKRAIGLQRCVMAAMAAHVEFGQEAGSLVGEEQVPLIVDCSELTCKRAFYNRPAWASHAARLHSYRAPSTRPTMGLQGRTCLGCGRTYAMQMQLKRHLDNSQACMNNWGSFSPLDKECSEIHVQAPPELATGVLDLDFTGSQDVAVCAELSKALCLAPCMPRPLTCWTLSRGFMSL